MPRTDLETLKEILNPDKLDMRCGVIQDLEVSQDRSVLRVTVRIMPEEIDMVARMSWELVGPDAGLFQFPSKDDVVLVAFCEDSEDEAYVIKRLTTGVEKIPVQAVNGHLVMRARTGTKTFVQSDTAIHLTNASEGTENLVLGQVFKTAYSEHLDIDSTHDHLGNMGYNTSPPTQAADYVNLKSSPVDDSAMLSDIAFTEK